MCAQQTLPFPLHRMFEHLAVDIGRSFELMPEKMQDAMQTCVVCDKFHMCDYNSESRYFRCPNRGLLDELEDMGISH